MGKSWVKKKIFFFLTPHKERPESNKNGFLQIIAIFGHIIDKSELAESLAQNVRKTYFLFVCC